MHGDEDSAIKKTSQHESCNCKGHDSLNRGSLYSAPAYSGKRSSTQSLSEVFWLAASFARKLSHDFLMGLKTSFLTRLRIETNESADFSL